MDIAYMEGEAGNVIATQPMIISLGGDSWLLGAIILGCIFRYHPWVSRYYIVVRVGTLLYIRIIGYGRSGGKGYRIRHGCCVNVHG